MSKGIIIAIDGFSSTGKSTIAKLLAKKYNYIYVDTGAMYRAVTLFAKQNNFVGKEFLDKEKLILNLKNISLSFQFNKDLGFAEMYLNNINVEKEIRTLEISQLVSKVSTISEVRSKLVFEQQIMGENSGIVMDGRDIGTVVFPNAELKIFMTASAQTRAQRRWDELSAKGEEVDFDAVYENITSRDHKDSTRADSPLTQAQDARILDNSKLTPQEQFELVLGWVNECVND
jgi:cytidylate kinase